MTLPADDELQPLVEAEYTTYRVQDYLGWQRDKSLVLRPRFQRGNVWKEADKSLLIDSALHGYPVPIVILQQEIDLERSTAKRRVVDGQQRLRTFLSYIDIACLDDPEDKDAFTYSPPGARRSDPTFSFSDLSPTQKSRILNTRISAIILNPETSDKAVLEVYDRLNSSGSGLTNQELRYARREGQFSNLCYDLARNNQNRWTEWRIFREQDISRMLDVELTSELILLMRDGIQKTGRREIDAAYKDATPLDDGLVSAWEATFMHIMDALDSFYGSPTAPDPVRPFRSRAWIYSIFSFVLYELGYLDEQGRRIENIFDDLLHNSQVYATVSDRRSLAGQLQRALERYQVVRAQDPGLARAVSGAASDKSARVRRFKFLSEAS